MNMYAGLLTGFLCVSGAVWAGNPMVPDVGMADPHIRIFNGKAYLYSTRDSDDKAKRFTMPDWHVWSSDDLIHWQHETTILPTQTYMGESTSCWATDAVEKNGNFYFYFSNGNVDTGVMVAHSPVGPFQDALGKPLLASDLMDTKEYDPSVLIDDSGDAYIIFGHHRDTEQDHYFAIAKLNEDMVSLAEYPKEVKFTGTVDVLKGNDKPTLHKRNGIYYLSAGSHYAMSDDIYGPYRKTGNSGNGAYGLSPRAHGNYFDWNNQSFHTWCHFHLGKEVARYRESYITYLHYKDNGEMVDDVAFLDAHFATGVGQYDASWDKIEAEWYMAAAGCNKVDLGDEGFQVVLTKPGAYLYYPNIADTPANVTLSLRAASKAGGSFEVRENTIDGSLLGTCDIPATGGPEIYKDSICTLKNSAGKKNIYFVLTAAELSLDRFAFSAGN
ncbi:MAG: family 43 glycosylhydrolase [Gammaproteobacteria bacterium]|nr:family 43 glycosylhydrolase [Gammaproteobacteria bacterium]